MLLHPGDVLLYRRPGFVGGWIRIKTWSDIDHVETYVGNGKTFTARPEGVRIFPFQADGLRYVLRPVRAYDHVGAARWRATVIGQGYDWLGLLVFYIAAWQGSRTKMFCSEAVTRDARAGDIQPFAPHIDADRVAPSDLLKSSAYRVIYRAA